MMMMMDPAGILHRIPDVILEESYGGVLDEILGKIPKIIPEGIWKTVLHGTSNGIP